MMEATEKESRAVAIASAATDLVNRIDHEASYLFTPRYTELGAGSRIQINPHAKLDESDQTQALLEGLSMIIGQLAAGAFISAPAVAQPEVYNQIFRRIRVHTEAYHQQFLKMREKTQDENSDKRHEGGDGAPAPDVPAK